MKFQLLKNIMIHHLAQLEMNGESATCSFKASSSADYRKIEHLEVD